MIKNNNKNNILIYEMEYNFFSNMFFDNQVFL